MSGWYLAAVIFVVLAGGFGWLTKVESDASASVDDYGAFLPVLAGIVCLIIAGILALIGWLT